MVVNLLDTHLFWQISVLDETSNEILQTRFLLLFFFLFYNNFVVISPSDLLS